MASVVAQLAYQVCPIILTGGSASQIPGGMMPLISVFYLGSFGLGLPFEISGGLDDSFSAFNVLPGGTLISQQIGKYPFANQTVAANATIAEPLTLSVIMDTPMRGPNPWIQKQLVFSSLKATLDKHNQSGGTYTVATPAYLYTNMIMTSLTDNSRGNNSLPQNAWRFDFERPLTSMADLQGALNQVMSKLGNQVSTDGATSGPSTGTPSGQTNLSGTIKTVGGMTGGTPLPVSHTPSANIWNYIAAPSAGGYALHGIS